MTTKPEGRVILLMGPTASGKTELAMGLHQALGCELISVDSAQIYRQMDIGTAKPTPEELRQAPHHLIDILDPAESYSAARFRADALAQIEEILARGKTPLLVGGTMLYFRALLYGLSPLPEADPVLRTQLEEEAAQLGWQALHRRLAEVDPVSAARIHPHDPQRIGRALEVFLLTGRTLSSQFADPRPPPLRWPVVKLALLPRQRQVLHQRIAQRFARMLELDFAGEVRNLLARGDLSPAMPSLRCVGYRQMAAYLGGEYGYDQMVERGVVATRQLAKRQLTWLRSESDLHILDEVEGDLLVQALKILSSAPT